MDKAFIVMSLFMLQLPAIPSKSSLKCLEPVEMPNGTNSTTDSTRVRVVRCSEFYNTLSKFIVNLSKGAESQPSAPPANQMKFLAKLMGLGRSPAPSSVPWTFSTRPKRLLGRAAPKVYNSEGEEEDFGDIAEGSQWQLDQKPVEQSEGLLTRLFKPVHILMAPLIDDLLEDEQATTAG